MISSRPPVCVCGHGKNMHLDKPITKLFETLMGCQVKERYYSCKCVQYVGVEK